MLKIGITGGIGSGKTTAARLFGERGIDVFYTDTQAKLLLNRNPEIKVKLMERYGDDIYDEDLHIRSEKLAKIMFNNPFELKWMNDFMFPYVQEKFEAWYETWNDISENHTKTPDKYCMIESAILVESGANKLCDAVIVVMCPVGLRIKRAMERDNATREQIEARVRAQMSDEDRLANADYVIWNTGSEELLEAQVKKIHDEIVYFSH